MKNLVKIMMVLAALLVLGVGQVWAYPIESGDLVSLRTSYLGVNGAFAVYDKGGDQISYPNGDLFLTFCVERDVYFTPSTENKTTLYRATIDNEVRFGTNPGTSKKALSDGTKYLYWNFVNGTLADYNNDAASAKALQYAIWGLQGYKLTLDEYSVAQIYLSQVPSIADDVAGRNVKVMNLWTVNGAAQSQLIAQVPEPGTLLLFGSGLAGLAMYRRRIRK